jgi:hypothetical protein
MGRKKHVESRVGSETLFWRHNSSRHPHGADEEAAESRAKSCWTLEVISIQLAFKGMDQVTLFMGSGERKVVF